MCAERLKVTVGVCGGIAAYKSVELVRLLQDAGFDPHVIMTRAAEEFVRPLTFAAITGHKVITSLWSEDAGVGSEEDESGIEHINEAQTTCALIVAPATAHVLAKFAHGLTDDFLSTMYLATTAPVIMAPAMNVNMWNHPATRANVETLRPRGVTFVEPGSGYLACGMVGGGRLAENTAILAAVQSVLASSNAATNDLAGETILITAGGTREAIDPIRFIGNRSSGRMGFAIAEAAQRRGARIILIAAPTTIAPPADCEVICVTSAAEMQAAALERLHGATIVVMAAAVSDYTVKAAPQKLKRDRARTLELEPTADILGEISTQRNSGTLVIGFAAETENILANGRAKLERKGVDAIVVNDVSSPGLGFDSQNNAGTIVTKNGEVTIPPTSKTVMAERILDEAKKLRVHALTANKF
ncbi:MAG TPA: bifunctional phosphopantothenoylcysteine decarboxylase/phosphopantothenate--cysteine ligase CoaBC [Acidobacteriaceae bacterium]